MQASEEQSIPAPTTDFDAAPSARFVTSVPFQTFRLSRVLLLTAAFSAGLLLYLAVEPTRWWIAPLLTGIVALGADGIMREHPHAVHQEEFGWTLPLLFLPSLLALGSALFLEDALQGYWVLPGAAAAGAVMAAVLYAQHVSIEGEGPGYAGARFVLHVGTYLTAFALYASVYAYDVSLVPAALCVGLVSILLSIEVLREAEGDPLHALVFAAIVGLVVAEARWALYFLPLESYLAAVFLLLVFYLSSGLVQHHLTDDLTAPVLSEFGVIAVLGILIVTLGRIFEPGG